MSNKQKIFIFGASLSGESAKRRLESKFQILGFLDNDSSKVGAICAGLPVYAPKIVNSIEWDHICIASEFIEQIHHQLTTEFSISPNKIINLPATDIKPFRFSDDPSKTAKAEQVLGMITNALHSQKLDYYIDAGTLLGIYRDNALIPWDDDLDIAIPATALAETKLLLQTLLPQLKAFTKCDWIIDEYFSDRDYGAVRRGDVRALKLRCDHTRTFFPAIDFFIKYEANGKMDYALSSRGITMPSCYLHHLSVIQYKGYQLAIPADTEGYLSQHYGSDWRTPKQNWSVNMLTSAHVFTPIER